jgi:UDP-N-acetylmuramyl pentapeptide phosphotransferase/UDP-N-acetylglucosamine-1-phosphate transferase
MNYLFYILIFIISIFITFFFRKWALRKSILDLPNERSSHSVATPRGGGIAIVVSFYLGLIVLFITKNIDQTLFLALLPGLALAIAGFIDDIKGLSHKTRLLVHFLCAVSALIFLKGFQPLFGNGLFWIWSIIGLIGIVWFINLYNFMDGSDGFASMEAIAVSLAFWFFTKDPIFLLLIFSVAGFLVWNWPKAKIFMGDIGSTVLGFVIIVLGLYFHNKNVVNFNIWLLITALFWFDATYTLLIRIIQKENFITAHKNHAYQKIIQNGFTHLHTLIAGFGFNIVFFILAILSWYNILNPVVSLAIVIFIWSLILIYISRKSHKLNR